MVFQNNQPVTRKIETPQGTRWELPTDLNTRVAAKTNEIQKKKLCQKKKFNTWQRAFLQWRFELEL